MKTIKASSDELKIIIPTYKRETVKQQIAYSMIPDEFKDRTYFVVREERLEKMMEAFPQAKYIVLPEGSVTCISDTRQWILDNVPELGAKQWYFDDDVKLFQKRDENYRIRGTIGLDDFTELYDLVSAKLDEYPYLGLAHKLFNNLATEPFQENTAIYTCFAIRADVLHAVEARYDELWRTNPKITVAEDKWVCAYLLSKGYKNIVLNEWVYDQKDGHIGSTDTDLGGNYGLKTKEANDLASKLIVERFPGFTFMKTQKVKDKEGNVIDEYKYPIIRWQKLYENSLKDAGTSGVFDFA